MNINLLFARSLFTLSLFLSSLDLAGLLTYDINSDLFYHNLIVASLLIEFIKFTNLLEALDECGINVVGCRMSFRRAGKFIDRAACNLVYFSRVLYTVH